MHGLQYLLDIILVTTGSVSRYKTEMQNMHPVALPTQQVTRELLSYPLNLTDFYCKPTVVGLTKKEQVSEK